MRSIEAAACILCVALGCALAIPQYKQENASGVQKTGEYRIGKFSYEVNYSLTLGEVKFPIDDDKGKRIVELPYDLQQRKFSLAHEVVHACFHNHEHHFRTKAELQKHIDDFSYGNEESVAAIVGLCIAESEDELFSRNTR